MKRKAILVLGTIFIANTSIAKGSSVCPNSSSTIMNFDDAIAIKTSLNVNGDGALAAYTTDNAGYIYWANGVDIIENEKIISCKRETKKCNHGFKLAAEKDFAAGTPEFCVFGMAVVVPRGKKPEGCPGKYGTRAGNGKGSPKPGKPVTNFQGRMSETFVSTTAMQHMKEGEEEQLDALTVPALVAPSSRASLLGSIVWLKYKDREVFAVVGDTGPAFGEGSIALHQLLRYGELRPAPPPGVIPAAQRCGAAEMMIERPYMSRAGEDGDDECGRKPISKITRDANVRAWGGTGDRAQPVEVVVFTNIRVPMNERLATSELTPAYLADFGARNVDPDRLNQIRSCLTNAAFNGEGR